MNRCRVRDRVHDRDNVQVRVRDSVRVRFRNTVKVSVGNIVKVGFWLGIQSGYRKVSVQGSG